MYEMKQFLLCGFTIMKLEAVPLNSRFTIKYCNYVKEEQYLNLNVYLKSYEENYLNDDY